MGAKVISILNPKGGAGKTTIATNLARALQLDGYKVLIADADPQGTARAWSSIDAENEEMVSVVGVGNATMEKEIKNVSSAFDFIVIDGGAKLDARAMAPAIKISDLILIPVQPSGADIWAAADLVDVIVARQELLNGEPKASFVVSRQVVGTGLAADVGSALDQQGIPVLKARTSQRVAYTEALTNGVSVIEEDREGKAKEEVIAIKDEVLGLLNGKGK